MVNKNIEKLALGMIEFNSIPVGYKITNEILKSTTITHFEDVLASRSKYIALFFGSYENVEYALDMAMEKDYGYILDIALLGNIHKDLQAFLNGKRRTKKEAISDIGIIKTETFSACLEKANQILHLSYVHLIDINYSDSLHGDCLIIFHGNISNINEAIEKAGTGELLSNPDEKIIESILKLKE